MDLRKNQEIIFSFFLNISRDSTAKQGPFTKGNKKYNSCIVDGNSLVDSTSHWGLWRTCSTYEILGNSGTTCKSNFEDYVPFEGKTKSHPSGSDPFKPGLNFNLS